jgi:type IV pilus biogenesis protein CpaD/CtpE
LLIYTRSLISVYINLIIQVSRIQGHKIRIVSYALLDSGDCRSIKVGYVVYILTRPPRLVSAL